MNKSTVRFAPWVGPHYERGIHGLRILVVCESHYGAKVHERPTVTPEILKALALGQKHPKATARLRRHAHFTKIMASILSARTHPSKVNSSEFWHSIAYYNFIQEFLPRIRKAPSGSVWEKGKRSFAEVLDILAPELIVCFSKRNGRRVTALAGDVPVAVINHPSSHFAYSAVNPVIAESIERALARKEQVADFAGTGDLYLQWCEATASALPTPGKHLSGSDKLELTTERVGLMAALDEAAQA
ncbi:hypothetical protein JRG42_24665 [Pseudomonas granadensis]|uniref:hypothetical protein n=1 Tax=Pseudomonas granadensis TaxID=1421430 RepID=UPI0019D05752|nr:hypothetical protein [Pseudomonas granadensis]MBN6776651.1 hypothetical protein [Pseudomonas granadensis]MBN6807472.1 hypothetical protein [Pseudomonas granadensis]MBN6834334.1 hypothetical protein [Pseudomonas granadensis]MBN6841883.1 hypothetical protein [Pseudomonas granadensis]MBN6870800.1 hypothetical protein [Pseudomonas granadensis]